MSECKQKRTSIGSLILFAFCVGVGVFVYLLLPKYFNASPYKTAPSLIILITIAIFSFFLSIILHEAGHLVFGLMTGYKFSSFRIGAIMLVSLSGKMKIKLHTIPGTAGQCLLSPPDLKNGKMPHILYNLGGVISNVVFAALFGTLGFAFRKYFFVCVSMTALSSINLVLGASNGIPYRTNTVNSDGMNALSLAKNPTALRALWIQLKINSETANGKRLSEMPGEWFSLPEEKELENPLTASIVSFKTSRLMDEHKFPEALDLITEYKNLPALPEIYRSLMALDEISIRAIQGDDYTTVASLFTKGVHTLLTKMKNFPSVVRTKYIFALLVENNITNAVGIKLTLNKIEKTYPYSADIASEKELMTIAENSISDGDDE